MDKASINLLRERHSFWPQTSTQCIKQKAITTLSVYVSMVHVVQQNNGGIHMCLACVMLLAVDAILEQIQLVVIRKDNQAC